MRDGCAKVHSKEGSGRLDRLRVVLALQRGRTLSAAGRALGVDHSTVARRLDGFERELGAPLFERGLEGFVATPLGKEVLATAEWMEREINGLLDAWTARRVA